MNKETILGLTILVFLSLAPAARAETDWAEWQVPSDIDPNNPPPDSTYIFCQAKNPDANGCTYMIPAHVHDGQKIAASKGMTINPAPLPILFCAENERVITSSTNIYHSCATRLRQ